MAVTLKEIAKIAGVSRGTVDRALHGREGVKSEVAKRIQEIAQSLDYLPNKAARALSFRKEPKKIVVIVPKTESAFFDTILSGIKKAQEELTDMGAKVFPVRVDGNNAMELVRIIDDLAGESIDGLVVSGPDIEDVRKRLDGLAEQGIPIITYNSDIRCENRLSFVGQDLYKSGAVAADLMSKIAPPGIVLTVTGFCNFTAHTERVNGFIETLKEKPVLYDVRLIEGHDAYKDTLDSMNTFFEELSGRTSKEAIEELRITGIFMAAGSVDACVEVLNARGLLGKVKIVANDSAPAVCEGLENGTIDFTICQDPVNQGYLPVKLIFDYLLNKTGPPERWIKSPVEIKTAYNLYS